MLLKSPRLTLRPITQKDFDAVYAFTGDFEVARNSSWGPLDEAQTREWIDSTVTRTTELGVVLTATGELIGSASFKPSEPGEAMIGYTLARAHWGKGYATEIVRIFVKHAFETLKLRRLTATTSPLNLASQKILEKSGFRKEAHLEKKSASARTIARLFFLCQ